MVIAAVGVLLASTTNATMVFNGKKRREQSADMRHRNIIHIVEIVTL